MRPVSWPSSLTAALASAAALALLYLALDGYGVSRALSLGSVIAIGFGSAVWTVAADALWQHGPAILVIAAGMLGAARARYGLLAMAGFGAALIRPPVVILIVAIGLGMAVERRDRRMPLAVLGGSLAGLTLLGLYNLQVFGRFGVSGGYQSFITENLASPDILALAGTTWDVLFSTDRGVFTYSPFVAVALVGLPLVWRRVPISSRVAVLGAILYLMVQYVSVQATPFQYTGGTGFSYYRYPIEPMFASVPLGAMGFERMVHSDFHWNRWLAVTSVAFACAVHALAAI